VFLLRRESSGSMNLISHLHFSVPHVMEWCLSTETALPSLQTILCDYSTACNTEWQVMMDIHMRTF
jgi:hypothetical protein